MFSSLEKGSLGFALLGLGMILFLITKTALWGFGEPTVHLIAWCTCLLYELIAFVCGIADRRSLTGAAGAILSGVLLLFFCGAFYVQLNPPRGSSGPVLDALAML